MSRTVARATRRVTIATLVSLTTLGLIACGGSGGSGGSGATSATAASGAKSLEVTLTDQGCSPSQLTAPAGSLTISVANGGTSAVTEMELKDSNGIILGERENIVAGLTGTFSLNVKPGRYVLSCPNGEEEDNGVLLVTGNAAASTNTASALLLAKALAGYRSYVRGEAAKLLTGVRAFTTALRRGDAEAAKALFGPVRRHYEAIEPVAESFGDLDPEIDARVNDVPSIEQWTGLHRIEQILWSKHTTRGATRYAKKLLADVVTLNKKVRALDFQAAQLANGAVELLNEVANTKITGEEDRYSHTDLSDFAGNLTGARVAFELLRPALIAHGDGQLVSDIARRFAAVRSRLDGYRRDTPLGFAYYSELTATDRRGFAQKVDALAEPLSTVAAKVAG